MASLLLMVKLYGVQVLGTSYSTGLPQPASSNPIPLILNIAIGIITAISLLFAVIGGFRFVLSGGDPQDVARAKSTVIYAIVGLVIAISAELIVSFVLNSPALGNI